MKPEIVIVTVALGLGLVIAWLGWLARLSLKLVVGVILVWLVCLGLGYGYLRSRSTQPDARFPARVVVCVLEELTNGGTAGFRWWAVEQPTGLSLGLEWRPTCPRSKLTRIDRK